MADQFGGDGLGQRLLDLALVGALAEAQVAEAGDDALCGRRAQVALQQMVLQLVQCGLDSGSLTKLATTCSVICLEERDRPSLRRENQPFFGVSVMMPV